jgi:hypothetical protein
MNNRIKMKFLIIACGTLFLTNSMNLFAQQQGKVFQIDTTTTVFQGSVLKTMAWCGGFNNPQYNLADLNNDGKKDLVVYDNATSQVITFINKSISSVPDYKYDPKYATNFPAVVNYLKLIDYNRDGIVDLFHKGIQGIAAFKGYYNTQNQLCFSFYKNLRYPTPTPSQPTLDANAYVSPADLPGFVDIDFDGDLDFFSYDVFGGFIAYYKNMQIEYAMPNDSIAIILRDECWGKSYQGFVKTQMLNQTCGLMGGKPKDLNVIPLAKTTLHAGNTICLLDIDDDGDYDYLNGNVSYNDVQLLINGKYDYSHNRDSIVAQDTTWPSMGVPAVMNTMPACYYIDIDQNGAKDILVAPFANNTQNYKNTLYYKNIGTNTNSSFIYVSDSFFSEKMIDLGTNSKPFFYDYDRDGKKDLIVGSDGFYQNSGSLLSRLLLFKNTSTSGNRSFTLINNNFLSIDTLNLNGAAPAIGDLDKDGKDDLLLGVASTGELVYFKNMALSNASIPIWTLQTKQLKDKNGNIISVYANAAPFIYDINKDGTNDLLIGCQKGRIVYYENTSTSIGAYSVVKKTDSLGGMRSTKTMYGNSTIYVGKIDNTSDEYIVLGSYGGPLYRYTGFQSGNTTANYSLLDSNYSLLNAGYNTAPSFADIENDGNIDLVLGNLLGGLKLYNQFYKVSVGVANYEIEPTDLTLYPNPAHQNVTLSINAVHADMQVSLYNTLGQLIVSSTFEAGANEMNISVAHLPKGVYYFKIGSESQSFYKEMLVD